MKHTAGPGGPWWSHLYTQVIAAIALGVVVGWAFPDFGAAKPLSDGFIRLVKMLITPVVFCTVVAGIARVGDLREVGRVGLKALVYFEGVSTLALAIGLVVVNVVKPGVGVNADLNRLDTGGVSGYTKAAAARTTSEMLLHAIPDSAVGAFASGEILQVLVFSVLFGIGLSKSGAAGKPVLDLIDRLGYVMFDVFGVVMRAAPVGAFGAMAYTVGKLGLASLPPLLKLMACVYLTCALFVFIVLGIVCRLAGFRLWRFLVYIKEEILLVLGTSSSEAALPPLMTKLEAAGCAPSVVGLVVPTGYSFNLDGTSIYLTMAAVFVAQAFNVPLTLADQLGLLAVLLLTSKGAAAVTGGGFITLAATLSATGKVPVAGLALLLGIDRFMSEARAITNLIGNGVAAMAVARWEGALDLEQARRALDGRHDRLEAAVTSADS